MNSTKPTIIMIFSMIFLMVFIGVTVAYTLLPRIIMIYFPFGILYRTFINAFLLITSFMVFFKANRLYYKTKNKKMALISAGFLAGSILQIQELLFISGLSLLKYNSQILYYLLGRVWAVSVFFTMFYFKPGDDVNPNFRRNLFIAFVAYAIFIIIGDRIIAKYALSLTYKMLPNLSIARITEQAFFLLSAFIYTDVRLANKLKPLSKFTLGLYVLALAPLFFIPEYSTTIYAFISPFIRAIGFVLIFFGLDDVLETNVSLNLRQKLSAYLSLFLILSYIVFIPISSIFLDIRFPPISSLVFIGYFILAAIIQYALAFKFTIPISNVIEGIEKIKPDKKPEKIPVKSDDEIGVLSQKIYESAYKIWEFTNREKIIREVIQFSRASLEIDQVLTTVCDRVAKLFEAGRATVVQFPIPNDYKKVVVRSEYKSRPDVKSAIWAGENLSVAEFLGQKLLEQGKMLVIDNIEQSTCPDYFKEFYKDLNVKSIIGAPIKSGDQGWGILVLSEVGNYRHWTDEEISLLEIIADQINIAIRQAELYSKTKIQLQKADLIRKIIEAIGGTLDLNKILHTVCDEVLNLFKVDRVAIGRFLSPEYSRSFMVVEAHSSQDPDLSNQGKMPTEIIQYLGKELIDKGQGLIINDINDSDIPDFYRDFHRAIGSKSLLNVPIKKGDDKWGILGIFQNRYVRHWTAEEIELMYTITEQVYIALRQAELFNTVKKSAERESLLRHITELIRSSLNIDDTLTIICDEVAKLFKVQRASIDQFSNPYDRSQFVPMREYKENENIKGLRDVSYGKTATFIGETVLDRGINMVIDNISNADAPDYFKEMYESMGVKSALCVPIKQGDNKWGVVFLGEYNYYRHWTEDEVSLLETIADQIFIAIKQAELYSDIAKKAEREAILRNIISIMRSTLDEKQVRRAVVTEMGKYYNADRVFFAEYSPKEDVSIIETSSEYLSNPEFKSIVNIPPNVRAPKWRHKNVFEKKEFYIPDTQKYLEEENMFGSEEERHIAYYDIKSVIGIPILYAGELQGSLNIHFSKKNSLSEEDLDFIRTIADQAGIAIYQAKLYNTVKENAEKERVLREIISEIKISENLDEIYRYLISKLSEIFKVDEVLFVELPTYKHENPQIKYEYKNCNNTYNLQGVKLPEMAEEIIQRVITTSKPTLMYNSDEFNYTTPEIKDFFEGYGIKSVLAMPLIKYDHKMEVLGIILMCSETSKSWEERDINLLQEISGSVVTIVWEIIRRSQIEELRNSFTLTLAHDLQVPLVGEKTALEFLMSRPDDQPIGKSKNIIRETLNSNQDLFHLLQKLLDSYAYESGKKELNVAPENISSLVRRAIEEVKERADQKQITINTDIQDGLPDIEMDKNEIYKVLRTFLENATTYTQSGGHIDVEAKMLGNAVNVCVMDNGPGIPPEIRSRIFERYAMAASIERKIGAGLGLYLAKQIIEAHKGKIWFLSEAGKGSSFYFQIPISSK